MSKRPCLTVDEVLDRVLEDSDDDDFMGELDNPNEPILEGNDDDFEDLQEQLYEEQEGTNDLCDHNSPLPLSFIHLLYFPYLSRS